jgi:hypothetical protein
MGFLDAFGLIDSTPYLVRGALEVSFPLLPHRQNDLHRFAQLPQTLWSVRIRIPIGAIFLLIPACPNANRNCTLSGYSDILGEGKHFSRVL